MRILFAGQKFDDITTGGERRISNILGYLEKSGVTVEYLQKAGRPAPWIKGSLILSALWNLKKVLQERPDPRTVLVNPYSNRYYLLIACIAARYITGLTIVTFVSVFYYSYRTSKLKNYIDRVVSKVFFRTAHGIIAGGNSVVKELKSLGVPPEKIRVIYPALRSEFLAASDESVSLKTDTRPIRILTVGRLHPIKGLEYLVEAVGMLDNREAELVIVGEKAKVPWYTEKVIAVAGHAGIGESVKLLGEIKNIDKLIQEYRKGDIFVLPSLWETSPSSLLEAMLMGLPVIACDVGGIPEVMVDGETGYLVKPGDPVSMSQAIKALINDPEKRVEMGVKAREHALSYISRRTWDDVGKDYYNTIVQLVERRTAAKPRS